MMPRRPLPPRRRFRGRSGWRRRMLRHRKRINISRKRRLLRPPPMPTDLRHDKVSRTKTVNNGAPGGGGEGATNLTTTLLSRRHQASTLTIGLLAQSTRARPPGKSARRRHGRVPTRPPSAPVLWSVGLRRRRRKSRRFSRSRHLRSHRTRNHLTRSCRMRRHRTRSRRMKKLQQPRHSNKKTCL